MADDLCVHVYTVASQKGMYCAWGWRAGVTKG